MSDIENLHRKWMKDPRYKKAHAELASEFELARAVIQARANAGLTQEELAKRIRQPNRLSRGSKVVARNHPLRHWSVWQRQREPESRLPSSQSLVPCLALLFYVFRRHGTLQSMENILCSTCSTCSRFICARKSMLALCAYTRARKDVEHVEHCFFPNT